MRWQVAVLLFVLAVGISLGLGLFAVHLRHSHTFQQVVVERAAQTRIEDIPAYATLEEAAVYAAKRLYACSTVYECGGIIVKSPDGKFLIGPLTSIYAGDHTTISRLSPPGFEVVAGIHSHPCLPDSHEPAYFSADDLSTAIEHGEPSFMLNECTGEVNEISPSQGRVNLEHPPDEPGIWLAKGEVIGKIPVSGAVVEPKTGFNQ